MGRSASSPFCPPFRRSAPRSGRRRRRPRHPRRRARRTPAMTITSRPTAPPATPMAHRDLTNALPAMMRPRDRQWLWARTHDKRINEDREARAYLDWLSEQQFRLMYDNRACLVRSTKEADGDYTAFGHAVLTVEP